MAHHNLSPDAGDYSYLPAGSPRPSPAPSHPVHLAAGDGLDIRFFKADAKKAVAAWEKLNLMLPAGQTYAVRYVPGTKTNELHVQATNGGGIAMFAAAPGTETPKVSFDGAERTVLTFPSSPKLQIVLWSGPLPIPDDKLISAKLAPIADELSELEKLQKLGAPSAKDLKRIVTLLDTIQQHYEKLAGVGRGASPSTSSSYSSPEYRSAPSTEYQRGSSPEMRGSSSGSSEYRGGYGRAAG